MAWSRVGSGADRPARSMVGRAPSGALTDPARRPARRDVAETPVGPGDRARRPLHASTTSSTRATARGSGAPPTGPWPAASPCTCCADDRPAGRRPCSTAARTSALVGDGHLLRVLDAAAEDGVVLRRQRVGLRGVPRPAAQRRPALAAPRRLGGQGGRRGDHHRAPQRGRPRPAAPRERDDLRGRLGQARSASSSTRCSAPCRPRPAAGHRRRADERPRVRRGQPRRPAVRRADRPVAGHRGLRRSRPRPPSTAGRCGRARSGPECPGRSTRSASGCSTRTRTRTCCRSRPPTRSTRRSATTSATRGAAAPLGVPVDDEATGLIDLADLPDGGRGSGHGFGPRRRVHRRRGHQRPGRRPTPSRPPPRPASSTSSERTGRTEAAEADPEATQAGVPIFFDEDSGVGWLPGAEARGRASRPDTGASRGGADRAVRTDPARRPASAPARAARAAAVRRRPRRGGCRCRQPARAGAAAGRRPLLRPRPDTGSSPAASAAPASATARCRRPGGRTRTRPRRARRPARRAAARPLLATARASRSRW